MQLLQKLRWIYQDRDGENGWQTDLLDSRVHKLDQMIS